MADCAENLPGLSILPKTRIIVSLLDTLKVKMQNANLKIKVFAKGEFQNFDF